MTEGKSKDEHDLTGQTLAGRYEVLECIGTGAMGQVYRAMHTMMRKEVAVKVLHPSMVERDGIRERFKKEAQAASHIDHKNICRASDFGEAEDGSFFLVMEFLRGASLKDRLEEQAPFSAERAAAIVVQMAAALTSAQKLGIVHRDLKPDNVFLVSNDDTNDFVKIVDFGIAQVYLNDEESTKLTAAGEVFGTPQYMAPEQAQGNAIDHRTDLYAIGVMFYEMLTGKLPFHAEAPLQLLWKHVMEPPPPMSEVAPDISIPPEAEAIVLKLMEKKPEDRYQSAAELLNALGAGHLAGSTPSQISMFSGSAFGIVSTTQPPASNDPSTYPPGNASPSAREIAAQVVDAMKPAVKQSTAAIKEGSFAAASRFKALPPKVRMGIIGGVAVLFLVILIVVFSSGDEEKGSSSKAPAADAIETQEAKKAFSDELDALNKDATIGPMIRLAQKRNKSVLPALVEQRSKHPDNLALLAVLGWAHGKIGKDEDGIPLFAELLSREPALIYEEYVIDNLLLYFSRKDDDIGQKAQKILEDYMNPKLADRIFGLTVSSKPHLRSRSRAALEATSDSAGHGAWSQKTLEFAELASRNCSEAKKMLPDIIAFKEPRTLPILKALKKRNNGCGRLGNSCDFKCMSRDLREAVETIEAIAP